MRSGFIAITFSMLTVLNPPAVGLSTFRRIVTVVGDGDHPVLKPEGIRYLGWAQHMILCGVPSDPVSPGRRSALRFGRHRPFPSLVARRGQRHSTAVAASKSSMRNDTGGIRRMDRITMNRPH